MKNARARLIDGIYKPLPTMGTDYYADGFVETRRPIDMIRTTSAMFSGAALSWVNMRNHTGHNREPATT